MNDEEKIALCRDILRHHFGTARRDDTGKPMKGSVCWVCDDKAWPCAPARLAQAVQEEVLAR